MTRKYKNVKVEVDGLRFDSRKEAKRYGELKLLEKAGQIDTLTLQPKFTLIDSQRNAHGKAIRPWVYIGDFMYREGGKFVIEDVKGMKTREYIAKSKAMLFFHGITVKEI